MLKPVEITNSLVLIVTILFFSLFGLGFTLKLEFILNGAPLSLTPLNYFLAWHSPNARNATTKFREFKQT